jgi:pyridoxamine 5'-phosphate oxidase
MAPNTPASEPSRSEELTGGRDPFDQFEAWFDDAKKSELNDPNAMAVATVDDHGMPNVRMVLLKGLDGPAAANRGFVFYTNFEGAKGRELLANPMAGLLFHWKSLERQVRVRGHVSVVTDAEADGLGPGHRSSRARSKAGSRWSRLLQPTPPNSASAPSRVLPTGRA